MPEALLPDREMPFLDHLRELRRRLMRSLAVLAIGWIVGYVYYDAYVSLLIEPFGEKLYMPDITEGFMLRMQIAFYAGIILSFPMHLYNLVAFILPALTDRERRMLGGMLTGCLVLTILGAMLCYFYIVPLSVAFLKDFQAEGTDYFLFFSSNLKRLFQLLLAFVVLFQLPMVMIVLMWMGIVTRQRFLSIGRYFIVVIFIVAAIFTPPDIISQIGLAVPLTILYYLAILVAKIIGIGASDD